MLVKRSIFSVIPALALAAALVGCAETPLSKNVPAAAGPHLIGTPTDITTGLRLPWSMVFVGTTALVSERDTGQILELDAAGQQRQVGRVPGVTPGGEGGLLGLAIDEQNRLYAYSTGSEGNRIQRFELEGQAGTYSLGAVTTILDNLPSSSYHNGGRIAFGPDGMLYAAVGDTGDSTSSQDPTELSGKILRLTEDGAVPADNPYPDSYVYSLGHRNVQGLAWASDGTMFATEFGQDTWDELNIITAGANYGWPEIEGKGGGREFVDPVQVWAPADASPSGLAIVNNTLFIANLRGEVLRAVPAAEPGASTDYLKGELGRLRAVAAAPDGTLWVMTNNTNGRMTPKAGDDRIVSVKLP